MLFFCGLLEAIIQIASLKCPDTTHLPLPMTSSAPELVPLITVLPPSRVHYRLSTSHSTHILTQFVTSRSNRVYKDIKIFFIVWCAQIYPESGILKRFIKFWYQKIELLYSVFSVYLPFFHSSVVGPVVGPLTGGPQWRLLILRIFPCHLFWTFPDPERFLLSEDSTPSMTLVMQAG